VDESVTLAQSVGTGNPNTLSFWLLPQPHGNAGKEATLKHRRLLEDKIIKCPVSKSSFSNSIGGVWGEKIKPFEHI